MKMLILYNIFSRNNLEHKFEIIQSSLSEKYDIDIFKANEEDSLYNKILEDGNLYDVILALGGDGTVNVAVNAIMHLDKKPKLAILPFGTCNDIARSLGIKNIKKGLKMINEDSYGPLNIYKINDSYFVYGLATGGVSNISYEVDRKQKRIFGKNAYYLNTLKAVFEKNPKIDLIIDDGNFHIDDTFYLMLAINTRYLAGFKIKGGKKIYNSSKLRVILFKKQHRLTGFISFALYILFGIKNKNVITFDTEKLSIICNTDAVFNTDGEYTKFNKELDILSLSNELIVFGKTIQ